MQLDLRASSAEDLRLTALQFTTAGSGDDAVDVASADLYLDADSDGALDLAIDSPIALGAVPAADDGALTFAGLSEVLAAGSITRWLVVYDLSGTSADASNLRVDLVQASDVTLQGISSAQAIAPSGLPLSGATVTVTRAQLDVALGPFNPARTALPTASLVPVLQLSLSAGAAEACVVSELVIRGAGPGDESVDISGRG